MNIVIREENLTNMIDSTFHLAFNRTSTSIVIRRDLCRDIASSDSKGMEER